MKAIYELSLEELQALRGTLWDCPTKKGQAMSHLMGAIISVYLGISPDQDIDFALVKTHHADFKPYTDPMERE